VCETTSEKAQIIEAMGAVRESWLPGYRIKVLDGNCMEATEHRLRVLRETNAGALPGKAHKYRRIRVKLNKPTLDGERELSMAFTQLAQVLLEFSANVKLSKFRKHRRGPKKPRP
jgi:hypothetical protein